MRDEESLSLWDHITGEAFEGKLAGQRLDWWAITITTVAAALASTPNIILLRSNYRSPKTAFLKWMHKDAINGESFLPPGFRSTMSNEIDPRLDKMEQGLGVIIDDIGKYYPSNKIAKGGSIKDTWNRRELLIERNALDGVPFATWVDGGEPPMQLLTRWYGFSFTYPNCEIYGA